jgi:hypothetical protein
VHHIPYFRTVSGIQITGWFIRKHQSGGVCQRAGQGNSLLLATGELNGIAFKRSCRPSMLSSSLALTRALALL